MRLYLVAEVAEVLDQDGKHLKREGTDFGLIVLHET
jgi:hypothetical protein